MATTEFQSEVTMVVKLYKSCVNAWRSHPCYDGDDRYPHVRAVCRTRGPETLSWSINQLNGAYGDLRRMQRHRIIAEEVEFAVEPIHPTDPVHPYRVADYWRFPTKAGAKYSAKKLFRELFPALRPALTQACKVIRMPAWRDPDTKHKQPKALSFRLWLMRQPKLSKAAADLLIAPGDIWDVANGKLPIEEVEKLGIRQYPILAECERQEAASKLRRQEQ